MTCVNHQISCDCEGNYRPIISAPFICLRDAKKQKSLNKISPYFWGP